jgi:Amt family ammonium transporter
MYQLMFAVITPALIVGAIAERMKYTALMLFILIWMFAVYFPMAHMVWGITGFMNGIWNANSTIKAIDFAGGTVVHMTSGWSALILCLILGPRIGFKKEPMAPHSIVLCMVGTGMLWVGWYGFNAGSAVAADGIAANAFMTTTLATGIAALTWAVLEKVLRGKASVLGYCTGAVAGLVVITPACGFVNATGSVIIGVLAAVLPYIAVSVLKPALGYDDALDTFGVHAVGGTIGALLTGLLATKVANPNLKDELLSSLFLSQAKAVLLTLVLATVATAIIAFLIKLVIGLRTPPEIETAGLDISEHGEEAYIS